MTETQLTTYALVSHSLSGMFSLVPQLPLQLILKGYKISVAEALPCSLSAGIGYYVSLGCCASMLTPGCNCVFWWYMRSSYSCTASSLMLCRPGHLLLLRFRTLENSESQCPESQITIVLYPFCLSKVQEYQFLLHRLMERTCLMHLNPRRSKS